ncbi:hypothetical protein T11_3963, partial [Trichinella zimbabwensis]
LKKMPQRLQAHGIRVNKDHPGSWCILAVQLRSLSWATPSMPTACSRYRQNLCSQNLHGTPNRARFLPHIATTLALLDAIASAAASTRIILTH